MCGEHGDDGEVCVMCEERDHDAGDVSETTYLEIRRVEQNAWWSQTRRQGREEDQRRRPTAGLKLTVRLKSLGSARELIPS